MGREESVPSGRPKEKLEPTDVILSYSHARKLAFYVPEFFIEQNRKGKFFVNIDSNIN